MIIHMQFTTWKLVEKMEYNFDDWVWKGHSLQLICFAGRWKIAQDWFKGDRSWEAIAASLGLHEDAPRGIFLEHLRFSLQSQDSSDLHSSLRSLSSPSAMRNWAEATESETTEESLRNYCQQWGKLTDWNSGPGGSRGGGGREGKADIELLPICLGLPLWLSW